MADIYEQHRAAFARVSAFQVLSADMIPVATVAIKYPQDGAGRLYAYVHVRGTVMVRGYANGYGYDKNSAAVSNAFTRLMAPRGMDPQDALSILATIDTLKKCAPDCDSRHWASCLERAGFRVLQVI